MQITLKHMNAEEAWQYILRVYKRYQLKLKKFNYSPNGFIPNDIRMYEMFQFPELSDEQIRHYHDVFINEIHNPMLLAKQDENIKKAIPTFQQIIETRIKPLLSAWNAKMPETLTILCTYGFGASYSVGKNARITLRVSNAKRKDFGICQLMLHEFVHILIEEQIIQKYKVPQDLKERIVDIIGFELFDKPVQPMFEKSFANAYITPETIKTNLTGAVAKMMTDYTKMQSQHAKEK